MADAPFPRDPGQDRRTGRGQQAVQAALNSLVRRGELTRVGQNEWAIGGGVGGWLQLQLHPRDEYPTGLWFVQQVFYLSPSAPGAGAGAERFGLGATAAGASGVAVGNAAVCTGASSVAVGAGASVAAATGLAVAVGQGASVASASHSSVAVGQNSACSGGVSQVAVGRDAVASGGGGGQSTAVGYAAVASGAGAVVVGASQTCSAANGVLVGNNNTFSAGYVCLGGSNALSAVGAVVAGVSNTASHAATLVVGQGVATARTREFVLGWDAGGGVGAALRSLRWRVASPSSTNALRDQGVVDFDWADATDATRAGRIDLSPLYTTTATPGVRVDAGSGGPTVYIGPTAVYAGCVVNEAGADADFRAEGDTATSLFVLDAGLDAVQVGTTTAGVIADFRSTGTVLNEDGADRDFRVEGDTEANLLVADAGLDRVGVGVAAPAARLHVLADTIGDEVTRLESPGAGGDPNYVVTHFEGTTTNGTATAIAIIPTVGDTTTLVEVRLVARRTGGTAGAAGDGAVYVSAFKVKNDAGTASLSAVTTLVEIEDQAAWAVAFSAFLGSVRVTVTGAADNDVLWQATVITQSVGV